MQGLSLRSVLQPIVDAHTGRILGHEALLRGPAHSAWESPAALFAEADRRSERQSLESEARRLAVARLPDLSANQLLFVNVDPVVPPSDPPIPAPPDRVVLEITETRSLVDDSALLDRIAAWRTQGHRIAIDDYGAGYMGLGAALAVRPDIVKIDRYVTVGAVADPLRQAAVEAVLNFCEKADAIVIAEGVETPEEYWLLRHLGVRYMQGYLFGRPADTPRGDWVTLPSRLPVL